MIVTPYSAATSNTTDPMAGVTSPKKTLDSQDFMKLLAVQFQSQDPMKPMEDTAFIAQMAQFSSLEQSSTLTAEMVKLRTDQQLATANTYIGKNVTVDDGTGGLDSGQVSAVEISTDGPRIVVGDKSYSISSVLLVQPGTVSATQTATSTNP